MELSASVLIGQTHGDALRLLAWRTGKHFQGLAHPARKVSGLSTRMRRRLQCLDMAHSLVRHITTVSAKSFLEELASELEAGTQKDRLESQAQAADGEQPKEPEPPAEHRPPTKEAEGCPVASPPVADLGSLAAGTQHSLARAADAPPDRGCRDAGHHEWTSEPVEPTVSETLSSAIDTMKVPEQGRVIGGKVLYAGTLSPDEPGLSPEVCAARAALRDHCLRRCAEDEARAAQDVATNARSAWQWASSDWSFQHWDGGTQWRSWSGRK